MMMMIAMMMMMVTTTTAAVPIDGHDRGDRQYDDRDTSLPDGEDGIVSAAGGKLHSPYPIPPL